MKLENLCRMCSSEKLRVKPIFKAYKRERLLMIIKDVVGIDIGENDGLPSNICKPCATTLIRIQENLEVFRDNEIKLRNRVFCDNKLLKFEVCFPDAVNNLNSTEDAPQTLVNKISNEDASEINTKSVSRFISCSNGIKYISKEDDTNAEKDTSSNSELAILPLTDEYNETKSYVTINTDDTSDNELPLTTETTVITQLDYDSSRCLARPENSKETRDPEKTETLHNINTGVVNSDFDDDHDEAKSKLKPIRACHVQRTTRAKSVVAGTKKLVHSTRYNGDDPNRPKINDHKCYICRSESLGSAKALLEHLTTHLDRTPYTCSECKMETVTVKSVRSLNFHMKMHAQPMKCQYCDRRYCDERARDYHIKTYHLGESAPCPSSCNECGKVCKSISALKTHKRDHRLNLQCDHCERIFHRRSKLKDHIARVHEKAQKYECNLCKRVVHSLDSYNSHLKMHTSEKTYECDICPMKFYTAGNLGLHKKIHLTNANYKPHKDWSGHYTVSQEPGADKIYTCKLCGKSYTKTVMKINNHLKSHFKEIKCDRCDLMFVNESQLKVHYVVHTGIRQHKCEHCGKDFLHKNNLTQHLKIHRTERDYACEFCGKLFTYKEGMKAHIRNHHLRDSPYKCTHCRRKFVDNASLERHIAAEHEPQPVQVELGPPPLMGT